MTARAIPTTSADLGEMTSDGMTISEIAKELGVSYYAARARLRTAGLKAYRENTRDIRNVANGMKPLDAVAYLLDVLEQTIPEFMERHPVDSLGVKFSPLERSLLIGLAKVMPNAASRSGLFSSMYAHCVSPSDVSDGMLNVMVSRVRKKLQDMPLRIVSVHGYGYRIEDPQGLLS